jgi:hypothetical protein
MPAFRAKPIPSSPRPSSASTIFRTQITEVIGVARIAFFIFLATLIQFHIGQDTGTPVPEVKNLSITVKIA